MFELYKNKFTLCKISQNYLSQATHTEVSVTSRLPLIYHRTHTITSPTTSLRSHPSAAAPSQCSMADETTTVPALANKKLTNFGLACFWFF